MSATQRPLRPCSIPGCPGLTCGRYCEAHQARAREDRAAAAREYDATRRDQRARALYKSQAWEATRQAVIVRDHGLCQHCLAEDRITQANTVHHIAPLAEAWERRLDMGNLVALCASCHDRAHGKSTSRFASITLVCGPPGSGKTQYVVERTQPGDLVLDVDWLWQALSGLPYYDKPETLLPYVLAARDAVLTRLEQPSALSRAWVIATAPGDQEREDLATRLHARVVVLAVPAEVCLERIAHDERRSAQLDTWRPLVDGWWARYRPRPGDTVVER